LNSNGFFDNKSFSHVKISKCFFFPQKEFFVKENEASFGIFETILSIRVESSNNNNNNNELGGQL
jgi:hypothetical protein